MKKIIGIFLLSLLFIVTGTSSQPYFQKITTGPIATDVSSSSECAWGDYDNDGDQDLVVIPWNALCSLCTYPVLFYKNNSDGTFTREINEIGQQVIDGRGVAWGDYDNDGNLDLFITRYYNQKNMLFRNLGNGHFELITTGAIVNDINSSYGCGWADYNKDGWLDLFVANGQNQNDALYKNNGNGTFTKITNDPLVLDGSESRGCAWGDYDNDGWPDLFVVTYQGQNDMLYHNNGNGTFTRIFNTLPAIDGDWGAACAWGDYDNDGKLDLYVTFSNSTNKLYHNDGNGIFSLSGTLPSFEQGYSHGANWADFDNDGWIDLFVPKRSNSTNALFKNANGLGFTKVTNDVVGLEGGYSDAGIWGDYNSDGKIDLFVGNGSTSPLIANYFYKNITTTGNYITLKLKGCTLNRSAVGARIKLRDGATTMIREVNGGSGSQSMLWQHFGLGAITNIDSILVYWTTGNVSRLSNIQANQTLLVDECVIGIINNQLPAVYELKQNYPNPFNPVTQIEYSIVKSANVKMSIFDVTGKLIKILVNENQGFGTYKVDFDGKDLASGLYICKIETEEFTALIKMMLLK